MTIKESLDLERKPLAEILPFALGAGAILAGSIASKAFTKYDRATKLANAIRASKNLSKTSKDKLAKQANKIAQKNLDKGTVAGGASILGGIGALSGVSDALKD